MVAKDGGGEETERNVPGHEYSGAGRPLRSRSIGFPWHRLPVTFDTCELIPDRWRNWLRHDPVVAVEDLGENLKKLKALYIDCGSRDQFNLVYGARRLTKRLFQMGVDHRYEEFQDDHSGVDYRMDESLPFLAKALS